MYMSRIQLRPGAANSPAFWRLLYDGYRVHRQLWTLFAGLDSQSRGFLYRQEQRNTGLMFFTVSDKEPRDERGLWRIETKRYEPKIWSGQRLGFLLRVNPVRSKRDASRKQHRHDLVMEAKRSLKQEGKWEKGRPPEQEIIQREGFAWLTSRSSKNGFSVNENEVRVDGYRQHRWYKPRGGHQVRFSTVEITGRLTVTDPELFKEVLLRGIGPAKGFGCGLLMVRPI